MVTYPAELEADFVLPAIRKEICSTAIEHGLKQREIAEFLGITEAAASQYSKGKRAADLKFDVEFRKKVVAAVKKIIARQITGFSAVQMLSNEFRLSGGLCKIHSKSGGIGPETCGLVDVCLK